MTTRNREVFGSDSLVVVNLTRYQPRDQFLFSHCHLYEIYYSWLQESKLAVLKFTYFGTDFETCTTFRPASIA